MVIMAKCDDNLSKSLNNPLYWGSLTQMKVEMSSKYEKHSSGDKQERVDKKKSDAESTAAVAQ